MATMPWWLDSCLDIKCTLLYDKSSCLLDEQRIQSMVVCRLHEFAVQVNRIALALTFV